MDIILRCRKCSRFATPDIRVYKRSRLCRLCNTEEQRSWRRANPNYYADRERNRRASDPEYAEKDRKSCKAWRRKNPCAWLLGKAKSRAKKQCLPFNLEVSDIVIPSVCPILGIPLAVAEKSVSEGSPTLDRIDPEKGYVKGNVAVISYKANLLKNHWTSTKMRAFISVLETYEISYGIKV